MNLLPNLSENRIFYLDQLRVLAIIAVLFVHVSRLFLGDFSTSTAYVAAITHRAGHTLGVPLFFMISGVLVLRKADKISEFIKKRFSRILIPFIAWMIITFAVAILFLGEPFSLAFCKDVILANGKFAGAFWFVWSLLGLYLIAPVLNSFIENKGLKGLEYFLIIWLVATIIQSFNIEFLAMFKYFLGSIGYFVLGYYLANKEFNIKKNYLAIITILMAFVPYIISLFILHDWSILAGEYVAFEYTHIFNVITVTGVFLLFKNFSLNTNSTANKVHALKDNILVKLTLSLSICSYGIYLSHMLFIGYIRTLHLGLIHRNPLWIPFVVLIVLFGSWLLIFIMSKIPYVKRISGA